MLGGLASVIGEQKKMRPMLEDFFVNFILPEFTSEHAFLRCRVRGRECPSCLEPRCEGTDCNGAGARAVPRTM